MYTVTKWMKALKTFADGYVNRSSTQKKMRTAGEAIPTVFCVCVAVGFS